MDKVNPFIRIVIELLNSQRAINNRVIIKFKNRHKGLMCFRRWTVCLILCKANSLLHFLAYIKARSKVFKHLRVHEVNLSHFNV